jgi:predicted transcriptional regulator
MAERKNFLELELRNKIYHLVSKFAGSHLRELERRGGIAYSTLKYHLHFMVRKDLIAERDGRFYPREVSVEDALILGLLRQRNVRRILLLLVDTGPTGMKDLEDFTRLSASTVSWYLDRLVRQRVVTKERMGKEVRFKLIYDREKMVRVLLTYKESFLDGLVDRAVEMWEVR